MAPLRNGAIAYIHVTEAFRMQQIIDSMAASLNNRCSEH